MRNFLIATLVSTSALTLAAAAENSAPVVRHPYAITHTPPVGTVCRDCGAPEGTPAPNPPPHFNPLAASDQELQHYGFPPRPDQQTDPDGFAFWKKIVTAPVVRIQPKLQATTIKNSPARILAISPTTRVDNAATAADATSSNWSGYAIYNTANPFHANGTYVYGAFTVPAVSNYSCDGGWDYSSAWVGIDGWGSSDVFQAGIESDAYCSGSTKSSYYSAWYEWYPYSETRISSPGVAPGDHIGVYIWTVSATAGYYYMVNWSQGTASSLEFYAPSGTKLVGNSMEWIVERPGVNGGLATLSQYTALPWEWAHGESPKAFEFSPRRAQSTATIYDITMMGSSALSCGYATPNNATNHLNTSGDSYYIAGSSIWFFDEQGLNNCN